VITQINNDQYMPCWRFENLDLEIGRQYCDRHSRLKTYGQVSIWEHFKQNRLYEHKNKHHNTTNKSTRNCA
jgi:hypothetical protein